MHDSNLKQEYFYTVVLPLCPNVQEVKNVRATPITG